MFELAKPKRIEQSRARVLGISFFMRNGFIWAFAGLFSAYSNAASATCHTWCDKMRTPPCEQKCSNEIIIPMGVGYSLKLEGIEPRFLPDVVDKLGVGGHAVSHSENGLTIQNLSPSKLDDVLDKLGVDK